VTAPSPLVLLLALVALAGGLAAGCGGDDDSGTPATAEATTSDQNTASAAADDGAGGPSTDRVAIADFAFDPEAVAVDAGTKLTWTNDDEAPHTATADDGSFDTGTLTLDDTGVVALDQPGTYTYYCRFHPFMKGTVEVR
jgi:plastocyanin